MNVYLHESLDKHIASGRPLTDGFRVSWSSSEVEGEVRMEDGGHVNVARITE